MGRPMPVPVSSLVATTRATLAAHASVVTGAPVGLHLTGTAELARNGSHP
jgi:hypothetical protein